MLDCCKEARELTQIKFSIDKLQSFQQQSGSNDHHESFNPSLTVLMTQLYLKAKNIINKETPRCIECLDPFHKVLISFYWDSDEDSDTLPDII